MVRLLSLSAAAAAGFASAAAAETVAITMAVPPSGSAGPITGKLTGVDGMTYSNYKVMIATSADGGNTWWDKSHSPYFLHYQADPSYDAGNMQNAAVVLQSDWSFTLQGYAASPYDATSDLWVAMVVPSSYDMKWPEYQIEGVQMPANPPAIALAYVEVSKSRGRVAGGPGGCACGGPGVPNTALANNPNSGGTVPVASPSSAAAASPSSAAAASPSSAAAASPSSAAAASPSSAAAASPSSAAASPAGTGSGGNNALPGSSPAASPDPASSSLPAASTGASASTNASPGTVSSGASRSGLPATLAAGAAAVAAALFMAQ